MKTWASSQEMKKKKKTGCVDAYSNEEVRETWILLASQWSWTGRSRTRDPASKHKTGPYQKSGIQGWCVASAHKHVCVRVHLQTLAHLHKHIHTIKREIFMEHLHMASHFFGTDCISSLFLFNSEWFLLPKQGAGYFCNYSLSFALIYSRYSEDRHQGLLSRLFSVPHLVSENGREISMDDSFDSPCFLFLRELPSHHLPQND